MAQFHKFDKETVNLDHVVKIEYYREGPKELKKYCTRVYFHDGTVTGYPGNQLLDLNERTGEVVPAAPGFELLDIWYFDERPTIEFIFDKMNRLPIVAWRIIDNFATPICPDEHSGPGINKGPAFVCLPDGSFREPYVTAYKDAQSLLERLQSDWDNWQKNQEQSK